MLPQAVAAGARVVCSTRVDRVLVGTNGVIGAIGRAAGGGEVRVRARQVVLAASAVQTPMLLLASGIRHGPVGRHFQCHPGVAMAGMFAEPVRMWTGATQGHEVIGLRREHLKFEALGYDQALVGMRLPGIGRSLAASVATMDRQAHWGVALRAEAEGRVTRGWGGRPKIRYNLDRIDMIRLRRGATVLGQMLLAAGAEVVFPDIHGWHAEVRDPATMARLETEGPLDARAWHGAVTHMFGTCRLGSDPANAVVRPDFRHHRVEGLFVADSSVFPSNTGVNPQVAIMALAALCGERLLGAGGRAG